MIRPFFDQAIQFGPDSTVSIRLSTRITLGASAVGGFATLQTLKSPSAVCTANMSDFCFVEDACHAKSVIGDGARGTDKVCRIVKAGRRETSSIDPFRYLLNCQPCQFSVHQLYAPNGVSLTVCCWRNCCDGIEYGSRRNMLGCRRLEEHDIPL